MKNFRVAVNGTSYDVSVEELGESAPVAAAPTAQAAPAAAPQAAAPAGAYKVAAPMPGVVIDIKVSEGDKVATNQVVILLEAMKMENEIVTPTAGTIASVNVRKGDTINAGDTIVSVIQA